ncbi:uncharacterized protein LOC110700657 [Chenopodium quinoa]|uniref:Uncharacterized protein n=1 Tax=Chenopodium quinoa TaxID=63459 RepID=A0A803MUL9_CHEQI|nr:uncharacterized protein LOC110700657 [Chenopodium quinoa]
MAANLPFKRVVSFLQKRFFNAHPLPPNPKLSSKTRKRKIKSESILPNLSSFPIQYLTNSCGLSLESAIKASKRVVLEEKNKKQFDSVVLFLKSHNFTNAHIIRLIEKYPAVLNCRITSNLEPKLRFLVENGIKGLYLPKLVVSSPAILFRSLEAQLKPAMGIINRYVSCLDRLLVTVHRGSWLLTSDWKGLQENLDCLIEEGVPEKRIEELLVLQPRCLYQDISKINYAVKMIRCMGVKPTDVKYIQNFRVIMSLSKLSWKRKVSIFESLGWSTKEVILTFTKSPHCLSCSEKKLRNAMDYFVNTVKVDRETIIGYPKVLMYSIEKRVVPRFTIWKILKERKLIRRTRFIWMLNKSEKEFIDLYVTKYSTEIPYLQQIYMQSKGGLNPGCKKLKKIDYDNKL